MMCRLVPAAWAGMLLICAGCSQLRQEPPLLERMDPGHTGIHFSNRIVETDTMNILIFEYVFNGGGVGVADFNQDGLQDLYFSGNQVPNRLYLNQGNFQFRDVTEISGTGAPHRWSSGVTIVDINADGLPDIYACATVQRRGENRANSLFVNQGMNAEGIPVFREEAARWGIADTGHTTHAAFFDYDLDGDLDLYLLTNQMEPTRTPNLYKKKQVNSENPNTDRFYRNNGDGTFTNYSREAGITIEGYGLGLAVADFNQDGWPDVYVTNDYLSNDFLWINNQDGTFTNRLSEYFEHQSYSAMGNDVADVNGDGLLDLTTVDMLPYTNERKKALIPATNYSNVINSDYYGYDQQYVRNTLQINRGTGPDGHPVFTEVAQMAGIHETDWSWSPLWLDLDHDRDRDLLITNGFPRDITDQDFTVYNTDARRILSPMSMLPEVPVVRISNFAFRNEGNLQFSNATQSWGIEYPSFSNGAVYADLDNDGDLDYVVNNINDSALVYRNMLYDRPAEQRPHYIRFVPEGRAGNRMGLGAKVWIYEGGQVQFHECSPYRGYLSSAQQMAHFGLGSAAQIDSALVVWADGYQRLGRTAADQTVVLRQQDAQPLPPGGLQALLPPPPQAPLLQEVSVNQGIAYLHEEDERIDFNIQRTLPHKFSQDGPALAAGDLNGDGREDLLLGGAADRPNAVWLQLPDGRFERSEAGDFTRSPDTAEVQHLALLDADGDGDLDVYAATGSYEFPPNHPALRDLFYRNDGSGRLMLDPGAIPEIRSANSFAIAADLDRDGDPDLIVGGKVRAGAYPLPDSSIVLRNDGGVFTDATAAWKLPQGLYWDAAVSDLDGDGWPDLALAGEWMPLRLLRNAEGKRFEPFRKTGLETEAGWWRSIEAADLDGDGDLDLLAGNLGLNSRFQGSSHGPVTLLYGDFDKNGSVDPLLFCYGYNEAGERKPYPVYPREDLIKQLLIMRRRYITFADYGKASIDDLLTPEERKLGKSLEAVQFASSYAENLGGGRFRLVPLPPEAQVAPVQCILIRDLNGDGAPDALLAGNDFGGEVLNGRYDALGGLVLLGDGRGGFRPLPPGQAGLWVTGDARAVAPLRLADGRELFCIGRNRDSLRVFVRAGPAQ